MLREQDRTAAALKGIGCWDKMDDLESLPQRIAFVNNLASKAEARWRAAPRLPPNAPPANSDANKGAVGAKATATAAWSPLTSVAAFTTWSGDVWALRRELLPWLQWHAAAGVTRRDARFIMIRHNAFFTLHLQHASYIAA